MEISQRSPSIGVIGSICGLCKWRGSGSPVLFLTVASGLILSSCSNVPSLEQAAGDSQPEILIGDVVNRVKCELANSFAGIWAESDEQGAPNKLAWLRNWTAKVDLTLQINDSAGVSPSGSRTFFERNAFNYAAGSSSLTSNVIAAVGQNFSLGAAASYSEQAQRAETVSFTVSLKEMRDFYADAGRDEDGGGRPCDIKGAELRGDLGLKEWIQSALYPVQEGELTAGVHPDPVDVPSSASPKATPKSSPEVVAGEKCVRLTDATLKNAEDELKDKLKAIGDAIDKIGKARSAVEAATKKFKANLNTINRGQYGGVLSSEVRGTIASNAQTLKTITEKFSKLADPDENGLATATSAYAKFDADKSPTSCTQKDADKSMEEAKASSSANALTAARFQQAAAKIAEGLNGKLLDPPIDGLLHSVQFVVTYGGSAAPSWSLLLWKGPAATAPGLSFSGTRTNILNIALGSPDPQAKSSAEQQRLIQNITISNLAGR